jgi:glycosyltransferase involved in cell wall biosynthesis
MHKLMKKTKVTILVATYNQESVVIETLQSIENQTFKDITVIISDDGSTDRTRILLQEFVDGRENFHLYLQSVNLGITNNYNFLTNIADGEYVSIFAGDDIMCPDKIQKQVELLNSNPDASFCHHSVYNLNAETGCINGITSHIYKDNITTIHDVLRNLGIPGSMSVMYRKNMAQNPVFHPDIKMASDWFQIINLTMAGKGLYINEPLCYYRQDSNYNNKDTSKYEVDFIRTIELTRLTYAKPNDTVDMSCNYALSRYSLGAGYRALLRGDKNFARSYFSSSMSTMRLKLYASVLFLISFMPLSLSLLKIIKSTYKKYSVK